MGHCMNNVRAFGILTSLRATVRTPGADIHGRRVAQRAARCSVQGCQPFPALSPVALLPHPRRLGLCVKRCAGFNARHAPGCRRWYLFHSSLPCPALPCPGVIPCRPEGLKNSHSHLCHRQLPGHGAISHDARARGRRWQSRPLGRVSARYRQGRTPACFSSQARRRIG